MVTLLETPLFLMFFIEKNRRLTGMTDKGVQNP